LNDARNSTYKLGLLRALCLAADGASGFTLPGEDDHIHLPSGLIGQI
jgi:hypothetical protein